MILSARRPKLFRYSDKISAAEQTESVLPNSFHPNTYIAGGPWDK